jgi:L-rhamnonate dehydratase
MAQPHSTFCEYLISSPAGETLEPVFGTLFEGEILPEVGHIHPGDAPGFGLTLNRDAAVLSRPHPES